MHKLLIRQLQKHIGAQGDARPELDGLLKAIDDAYRHHDDDRQLLERSMDLMNRELQERNMALELDLEKRSRLEQQLLHSLDQMRLASERERQMEIQLRQSQKLKAIGQLAAGIAHEINTPIQFIGDNLKFLAQSFERLLPILQQLHDLESSHSEETLELRNHLKRARYEYLNDQIPQAAQEALEGVARVASIVHAMKEFAHPSMNQRNPMDLHRAIENTLIVARNEWKYVAAIRTDFAPDLPLVECCGDEIKQVLLNLIVNAAHAIGDVVDQKASRMGTITLRTRLHEDWVEIQISDDGCGIEEAHVGRIFEPFFTTKPVGKGSGQGLAIAHTVVVGKHRGRIEVETKPGIGTTFSVHLPIQCMSANERVAVAA